MHSFQAIHLTKIWFFLPFPVESGMILEILPRASYLIPDRNLIWACHRFYTPQIQFNIMRLPISRYPIIVVKPCSAPYYFVKKKHCSLFFLYQGENAPTWKSCHFYSFSLKNKCKSRSQNLLKNIEIPTKGSSDLTKVEQFWGQNNKPIFFFVY